MNTDFPHLGSSVFISGSLASGMTDSRVAVPFIPKRLPDKMQAVAMNLHEARYLALELMREHKLEGWTFRFDHARRRFGSCRCTSRVITLSRPLTLLNDIESVRDTILHEIAHALTPGDGHGRAWKAACVRIGAKPERCYTEDSVASPPRAPAPYLVGCESCNWWAERRRLTRRKLVCKMCRRPVVFCERVGSRQ